VVALLFESLMYFSLLAAQQSTFLATRAKQLPTYRQASPRKVNSAVKLFWWRIPAQKHPIMVTTQKKPAPTVAGAGFFCE
jgi:hypothetical protein